MKKKDIIIERDNCKYEDVRHFYYYYSYILVFGLREDDILRTTCRFVTLGLQLFIHICIIHLCIVLLLILCQHFFRALFNLLCHSGREVLAFYRCWNDDDAVWYGETGNKYCL